MLFTAMALVPHLAKAQSKKDSMYTGSALVFLKPSAWYMNEFEKCFGFNRRKFEKKVGEYSWQDMRNLRAGNANNSGCYNAGKALKQKKEFEEKFEKLKKLVMEKENETSSEVQNPATKNKEKSEVYSKNDKPKNKSQNIKSINQDAQGKSKQITIDDPKSREENRKLALESQKYFMSINECPSNKSSASFEFDIGDSNRLVFCEPKQNYWPVGSDYFFAAVNNNEEGSCPDNLRYRNETTLVIDDELYNKSKLYLINCTIPSSFDLTEFELNEKILLLESRVSVHDKKCEQFGRKTAYSFEVDANKLIFLCYQNLLAPEKDFIEFNSLVGSYIKQVNKARIEAQLKAEEERKIAEQKAEEERKIAEQKAEEERKIAEQKAEERRIKYLENKKREDDALESARVELTKQFLNDGYGYKDIKIGMPLYAISNDCIPIKDEKQTFRCYGISDFKFIFSTSVDKHSYEVELLDLDNKNSSKIHEKSFDYFKITRIRLDMGPIENGGITIGGYDLDGNILSKYLKTFKKKYSLVWEFTDRERELFNKQLQERLYVIFDDGRISFEIVMQKLGYISNPWLYIDYNDEKTATDILSKIPKKAQASDF